MNRITKLVVLLSMGMPLAACMTAPNNGDTFSGSNVGRSVTASGFFTAASTQVDVQVLNDPTLDVTQDANWTTLGSTTTSTSSINVNGTVQYSWSLSVTPVPYWYNAGRWPQGGLVKLRGVIRAGSSTYQAMTFDSVYGSPCLLDQINAGASGQTAAANCNGIGGTVAALVNTDNNPATLGSREFLSTKGDTTAAETDAYYASWGAPANLAAFKSTYGYPGLGDQTATYYNDTDLGVGREMHCWRTAANRFTHAWTVACYVTNYSDTSQTPKFGINNPTTALAQATARSGGFATVAMVQSEGGLLHVGRHEVFFAVYDKNGNRANRAQLDQENHHNSIPNNCLTCHGVDANYDSTAHHVTGNVQFLPFAVSDFKYSTQAGFTRSDQEGAFHNLNLLIRDNTSPSTAITSLINGAYGTGAVWNDKYVPSDWTAGSGQPAQSYNTLYTGVVRLYCRSCHISSDGSRDFATKANFDANKGGIGYRACQPGVGNSFMPHAEHPMRQFWASGARAYLNEYTADTTGCMP